MCSDIGMYTELEIQRFWAKVSRGPHCWDWAASHVRGYGQIKMGGRLKRAPRVSFELHKGPIPPGMHVLHTCDNPSCVNPDHLFAGSHADNMRDMAKKGRRRTVSPRGERNGLHKLTENQVRDILDSYKPHVVTAPMLAKKHGVAEVTIRAVVKGILWSYMQPTGNMS